MRNLSYNLSSSLTESLQRIENLRQKILITPLSQKTELRIRWEAILNRIYWSLVLSGNPLTKAEMVKLLISDQRKKRLIEEEQEVINYKRALDYISQNWLVTSNRITSKVVLTLHDLACPGRLRGSEQAIKQVLDYLQASSENPVVQAGVAQIQLVTLAPFTDGNGRSARLLALLFLYKAGFDFRGLLVLEEYFRRDLASFQQATQSVPKNQNLTPWLEYFAKGIVAQLEKAQEDLTSQRSHIDLPATFWELNDRQKEILTMLDKPDATITNKKVQKQFKVSQITASRDLSHLAELGLIFARGKGRSIYYTKV
jgi:Fic family protein